jgi:proteasome lid subunit RPN8/RPN11
MSNKDSKPGFAEINLDKCRRKEFPGGSGKAVEGELRVSFGRRAYDQIRKHTAEDTEHEVGGVLLGNLCKDDDGPFLHITEIISGQHTESQGAQVTFTHETWTHFHNVKDKKFPNLEYLGWYHSHPDFGIFLSSMDLFIHQNFFAGAHQVALVHDPIRREEGIFCWKDGQAEQAGKFWVGSDEHLYQPAPEPSEEQRLMRGLEKKVDRLQYQLQGVGQALGSRGESSFFTTALMMGILVLLLLNMLMSRSQVNESLQREVVDINDMARRNMVSVQKSPKSNGLRVTFTLPPESLLTEAPIVDYRGVRTQTYRLGLQQYQNLYLEVVRKAMLDEYLRKARLKAEQESRKSSEQKGQNKNTGTSGTSGTPGNQAEKGSKAGLAGSPGPVAQPDDSPEGETENE